MKNKFSKVMAQRSNAELVGIIRVDSYDYLPEARLAAKIEIEKRKLTHNKIAVLEKKVRNGLLRHGDCGKSCNGDLVGASVEGLAELLFFDF